MANLVFYNYGLWFWTGAQARQPAPAAVGAYLGRKWFFPMLLPISRMPVSAAASCHVSETTGSLAASQAASPPAISIRLVIPYWCRILAAIEER